MPGFSRRVLFPLKRGNLRKILRGCLPFLPLDIIFASLFYEVLIWCFTVIESPMDIDKINRSLHNPAPFRLHLFETLPSTNTFLFNLGKQGAPEWSVAVAERQTAGKGRYRRRWESPAGKSLLFSLLLRPPLETRFLNLINLFTALTLAQYLETRAREHSAAALEISLKWPNDLFIRGKKLCGILLEASFAAERLDYLVIGIGLNVNQEPGDFSEEIRPAATSLKLASGRELEREFLLAGFLEKFYEDYRRFFPGNFAPLVQLYKEKVLYLGKPISVDAGGRKIEGIFRDLTPEGYLVLERNGRETLVSAGDIFGGMAHRA